MSLQRAAADPKSDCAGFTVYPSSLDAGGNGAAPRASGSPGPNLRTWRGFGRFRYTQRNTAPTSVPATDWPSSPQPMNTIEVQGTTARPITPMEVDNQKALKRL